MVNLTREIYDCPITKYKVEYIINENKGTKEKVALFNTVVTDYKNMKAFLSLIRSSIDQLKEKNIQYICQTVTIKEFNEFLKDKTSWQVITSSEKEEICMIKCPIDDFLENYGVGLGL
ncbi:MAG: hypothetical protein Barrevirus31_2 [Barrevirus sp.]|uniref:Uncharacterized protein n=1 Tax=Barrevirus sp. TaxID=2487763 RepID=A0A3G4ZV54_9VIRU|nr:MAG: hypothetical protein Barrevirus31_2 [Barrevirus sp.]